MTLMYSIGMAIPALLIGYQNANLITSRVSELTHQGFFPIFVALDGPKEDSVNIEEILKTHKIASQLLDSGKIQDLRILEKNQGQGIAIPSSISWFFEKVALGLILEDDCELLPGAHIFIENAIANLHTDPSIGGICLTNVAGLPEFLPKPYGSTFTQFFISWGWVTSGERWREIYEQEFTYTRLFRVMKTLEKIPIITRVCLYVEWGFFLHKLRIKKENTWALYFTLHAILKRRLFITPARSLVIHGASEESVHVKKTPDWYVPVTKNLSRNLNKNQFMLVLSKANETYIAEETYRAKPRYVVVGILVVLRNAFRRNLNFFRFRRNYLSE